MLRRWTIIGITAAWAGPVSGLAAEAIKPPSDPLGVVRIAKGAPIVIGGYWTLSGPDTALGLDQKRAVEVAIADAGGKVAGHPVRLLAEDSQCSAEGGQTAAAKLAANQTVVVVLGPDCSSAATPGAPILWRAGIASIGTSTTAPTLTAPGRASQYQGFLRTIYSGEGQARGDAQWMRATLGCKSAATVHDGSTYAQQLVSAFERHFRELGGTIAASEAISPQDIDMQPMLARVATAKPCVLYYPVFVQASAQITRQAKAVSGLDGTKLVGGGAVMTKDFIVAAGKDVVGLPITYSDVSKEALGKTYPRLVQRYTQMFGEAPIQGFHAYAYDAAVMAFKAIEKVAVVDKAGNTHIGRKALRDALFATKGIDGASGRIECDANGDCQRFKFAVYQFTSADPESFEPGKNPKKIFPAP